MTNDIDIFLNKKQLATFKKLYNSKSQSKIKFRISHENINSKNKNFTIHDLDKVTYNRVLRNKNKQKGSEIGLVFNDVCGSSIISDVADSVTDKVKSVATSAVKDVIDHTHVKQQIDKVVKILEDANKLVMSKKTGSAMPKKGGLIPLIPVLGAISTALSITSSLKNIFSSKKGSAFGFTSKTGSDLNPAIMKREINKLHKKLETVHKKLTSGSAMPMSGSAMPMSGSKEGGFIPIVAAAAGLSSALGIASSLKNLFGGAFGFTSKQGQAFGFFSDQKRGSGKPDSSDQVEF